MTGVSTKRLAVALGFAFTLLGALTTAFYLAPAEARRTRIEDEITASEAKLRLIKEALATVDVFLQFGGMVFAVPAGVAPSPEARDFIIGLKQRAMHTRHEGIRTYIAQLALAGEVDFAAASARYQSLVDAETKNFNIDTYRAANAFEADLSMRAVKDQGAVAMRLVSLRRTRYEAARDDERRSLAVLALSVFGSTLLLLAAMFASSRELTSSGIQPQRPPPPSPLAATAARLIGLAIAEAKQRVAAIRAVPPGGAGG